MRGDSRLQHRVAGGLEDACFLGAGKAADIHGHQYVGRGVGALGADALQQLVHIGLDHTNPDAGAPGEALPQLAVGVVMPGGIDVDDAFLGKGRHGQGCGKGKDVAALHDGLRCDEWV